MQFITAAKSYAAYSDEITPDELYKGLLAHGMFAEKLPPFLTSELFFKYTPPCPFADKPKQNIVFESIRDTNVPRKMAIPHPFAYQRLCSCLKENWVHIQNHFRDKTAGHTHKISRIHLRRIFDKAHLFEMNYKNWRIDPSPEVNLLHGKHYLAKADISTCFPSIYTHALSWALVGKEQSKSNRGKDEWYNQIDHFTQNINHGETHGLLIGPHASNLLSEIILTTVDAELYKKHRYIRNIDDFDCYTRTHEEAERFIIDLNKQLQLFGLTLNHKKTSIQRLPQAAVTNWTRKLNSFDLGEADDLVNYKKARAILDLAIELIHENSEKSSILNYTIKILLKKKLTNNAQNYCAKTMLHLAFIYPYLVPLLDECVFVPLGLALPHTTVQGTVFRPYNPIAEFSNELFQVELKKANYEAVSYAIYFAIKYKFELAELDAQKIIETGSCIAMLLAHLYFEQRNDKQPCETLKNRAKELLNDKGDFDQNWLFVYEGLPESCLKDEWKPMKQVGVSFVDRSKLNLP